MRMLDFAEAQRTRKGVDRRDRRTDGPPLFQPDVPIDANAGQFSNFLAPKAGSATPPPVRKTDRFGIELGAAANGGSCRTRFDWGLTLALSRLQVLTVLG
jgi:hypothetical protein